MKIFNFRLSFPLVVFAFLFAACSNNDDDSNPLFQVEGAGGTIKFDNSTFTKQLNVTSQTSWSVGDTENAGWIKATIKENKLVLFAEPNASSKRRTAKLSVINKEGMSEKLHIEQQPTDINLEIVSEEYEPWFNYHETMYEFFVVSKSDWTLDVDGSWANADVTSGQGGSYKIVVNFDANSESKDKREALIKLRSGNKTVEQKIVQRGKKSHEDATHYFYFHLATLPVLYAGLDILAQDKPTYLVDQRNTLKEELLPSNVTKVSFDGFPNNMIDAIREIEKNNPDATYAYYADDLRITSAIPIFTRLGVDSSRVKLTLLPDGTGTYVTMFSVPFGEAGTGESKYKETEKRLEETYAAYMSNPTLAWENTRENGKDFVDTEIPHVLAKSGRARYYIENKDYLITDDGYVKNEIKKNNYVVVPPRTLLDQLSPEKHELFYKMVGFDMDTNLALMDASPKPNLIILGTNTTAGITSPEMQAAYVQKVIERYSSEYDIFFKAHPSDKAYLTYEEDFPGLKLIKPATMPFDVFTWALNDKIDAMGGFNTTVFITVPTDKVKFMFAKSASDLGSQLFYNIFGHRDDIYWIDLQ